MDFTQIVTRLNELTAFMNNVVSLSKKIFQLPTATAGTKKVAVYNVLSEQTEQFDLTEALAGMYSLTNGITALGTITEDGNDYIFSTGFAWYLNGVNYTNEATTLTINNASTGNYRIDIAVVDETNSIILISGVESDTLAIQPPIPPNTLLLCVFQVFEGVITTIPSIITSQNNIPLKVDILSSDLVTNDIAGFIDYFNDLNPNLNVLETTSIVQFLCTDTNDIYQLAGVGKGLYGLSNLQITSSNVLKFSLSGGAQNLQQVTDIGNTITDGTYTTQLNAGTISLGSATSDSSINTDAFIISDADGSVMDIRKNEIGFYQSTNSLKLKSATLSGNRIATFPNRSITVAGTDDVTTAENNAKAYADGLVTGLLDLRGNYDASSNTYPSSGGSGTAGAILKGDIWYVSVAGTLGGVAVNVGDSFYALVDSPGTTSTNWAVLDSNLGYTPEDSANKSTSVTTDSTSNVKYPSVKAVYDWVVGLLSGKMDISVYDTDASGVVDNAEKMITIGRNSTASILYKGTIVYISGSTGNRPNFVKAKADAESTSSGTFGVCIEDIAINSDGRVATIGTLSDLDTRTTATHPFTTDTLADGDTLYLSPSNAGYVTNVKPSAPNHLVYVGKVVRTSPTLGTIVYRMQNGYELDEIHDVAISSVANNDVLQYESATSLWKNKALTTASVASSTDKNYVTDAQQTAIGTISSKLSGYVYKNTTAVNVTGTTSETQVLQVTIPANTFSASDIMKIEILATKSGTAGIQTTKVKLSTSSTMPSGTTDQIATAGITNTNLYSPLIRNLLSINGGNITGYNFTTLQTTDIAQSAIAYSSKAFDPTVVNYLYVSITNASSGDTSTLRSVLISNL